MKARPAVAVAVLAAGMAALRAQEPLLTHGPLRGHADASSLHVFARAAAPGPFVLQLVPVDADTPTPAPVTALAELEHDLTLHFACTGLPPATAYTLQLRAGDVAVPVGDAVWTTGLPDDASQTTLVFGSCAHDRTFREQPIWNRILARAPRGLVLLGDTPYVDQPGEAARRQRHREFLAFPPIAAAMRTIPTWTVWDDHDYATNDSFGAVPAAAAARAVFVDYHAHASYGDGERGVHTSFRSGPIEVFVLDARSFADLGESPLAPGERTLFGAGQLRWLQDGLQRSTAPWKVLAVGMVWNDGVRAGKQDHVAHWRAERDALFGWIGRERIAGVVLLGGDVHRSRVVLHPTSAVVGYDLPELVSSPLAQNVIEANAVPTAGLRFDAGEAHSCLVLTATGRGDDAVLRAVFVAGDGREFHTESFSHEQLRSTDAAAGYRRLVARLAARFGDTFVLPESAYDDVDFGVGDSEVLRADWLAAVASVEPVLAAWRELAAEPGCRFRPARTGGPGELVTELQAGLATLQVLGVARALQAMAAGDVATLTEQARVLLAMARHLHQDPSGLAWSLAARGERAVAALQRRAGKALGAPASDRLRSVVREHLAARASLADGLAALRVEVFVSFDETLRRTALRGDKPAAIARQRAPALRAGVTEAVVALFASLDGIDTAPTPAMRDALRAWQRQRREAFVAARSLLGGLARPDAATTAAPVSDDAVANALVAQWSLQLCPDLLRFCEDQSDVLASLRDIAR